EALDMARRALAGIEAPSDLSFDWQTPLGWIRVRGRAGNAHEAHQLEDLLLLVDLGGHDAYLGPLASATPTQPISLCLDLSGNDTYASRGVGQAVGRCGIGILLDVSGDDKYEGKDHAQGVGQFGMGVLIDLAGNDMYMARWSAQGCAYFGIGLLIDRLGTDGYAIQADGQGFGGPGGVGVLADYSGNDHYTAEPDGELSGRPSYHSKLKISVSNAQGWSMGRRADGSDGHNWAGGLGALIDIAGNDTYVAGNWCHGTGYWFGMGVLYDGSGDDSYEGHVWSQATGAHFCIGLLLDEGGNDTHTSKSHNSLAFGHDFTHALLINLGGDDIYSTPKDGLGFSINRSVAALIDVGGNDRYSLKMTPPAEGQAAPEPKTRPGFARYDKLFADTQGLNTYWVDSTSLGLFLDIGGDDLYHADGNVGKAMDLNGQSWGDGPGSDNWKVRNHGIGVDVAEGSIDWRALPVKGPRR
ncbi:MAG: hypothetical protein ACE10D_08210, partial [Planctomycetota bacterium]